nr:LrgB family protein [Bacillus velezensis]
MSPYFGIVVSLAAFGIGTYLFKKREAFSSSPRCCRDGAWNPFLKLGGFSYEDYKSGGDIIKFFLEPATIAFAIPLYKQRDKLKKYWWQIMSSIIVALSAQSRLSI